MWKDGREGGEEETGKQDIKQKKLWIESERKVDGLGGWDEGRKVRRENECWREGVGRCGKKRVRLGWSMGKR